MGTGDTICLFYSVFFGMVFLVVNEQLFDCPLGWQIYDSHCYRFVFYPKRTYSEASTACQVDGAYMVSVNTRAEDAFISAWLNKHDNNKANTWITSGLGDGNVMKWSGDATPIMQSSDLWVDDDNFPLTNNDVLVYEYTILADTFKWARGSMKSKQSYICEISLNEAYRIVEQERDLTYGREMLDVHLIPRGPIFVQQPQTVVVVQPNTEELLTNRYNKYKVHQISIECRVVSHPDASYVWFKYLGEENQTKVDSMTDRRYTVTNGKLIIEDPSDVKDSGSYRCVATNKIGSVVSEPATIVFGFLSEFSNDPRGPVIAKMFRGTSLKCETPAHNPTLSYQWYKTGGPVYFLRFDLNSHMFPSWNGGLYFSETDHADAGLYNCVVHLAPRVGQVIATKQSNSRSSLGIPLNIIGASALDYGPGIHKDFPIVFPNPALRGDKLRLECFAFGKLPLYYSWRKDGGPVPEKSYSTDHGMVLVLPNAQLEDSGNYTCEVRRDTNAKSIKTVSLSVEAVPFFVFPLRDQHIDEDRPLTWRCEALGRPNPVYTWYKNAVPISPTDKNVLIRRNILTISKVNKEKHNGMYQCEAKNVYGTTVTSAQLRVVAFPPSFFKRPLNSAQMASVGGSVTFLCQPEASPEATVTWLMNGRKLPTLSDIYSRVVQLKNGNLFIKDLQLSDSGEYTCVAANRLGNASSSGFLYLVPRVIISTAPTEDRVHINGSIFLPCQASFDKKVQDLIYVWDLHGTVIDVENDAHYRYGTWEGVSGLRIINAQLRHAGLYSCTVLTVSDKMSRSAHIQVLGPPAECSGMKGETFERNVSLRWIVGADHGSDILSFTIEFHTDFNPAWRSLMEDLPYSKVIEPKRKDRCRVTVSDLKPGSSYQFRVVAKNRYGPSPTSIPSPFYRMADAAPMVAVGDVREGSGPVGTLNIEWDELNPEDLTGDDVGYIVYYRLKEIKENKWSGREVKGRVSSYTVYVGPDNYFLEYEIMVGVFNSIGSGPNSSVYSIMSAEGMPIGTPTNVAVDSINATAIIVNWDALPTTREFIRGRIQGYQINYWLATSDITDMGSTNIYCDCGEGIVVGLDTNEDYWVNVQVFTRAGMGPMSEENFGGTFIFPPLTYPEFVHVSSYSGYNVLVEWRGVNIGLLEETLIGYKMRWWPAYSDIRSANDTIVEDKRTYGLIKGIEPGVIYALRVLGFSNAGDGKKSPTIYFTLEGQVLYNPETTAIMNIAHSIHHHYPLYMTFYYIFVILLFLKFDINKMCI